jgi:hypothetical protein
MIAAIGWRSVRLVLPALVLSFAACGGMVDDGTLDVSEADLEPGGAHQMPLSISDGTVEEASVKPAITAHLSYFGGRVVSSMQIPQVLYGIYGSGTYLSNITSNTAPSMSSFYGQVSNSNYVTWLTEYNTPSQTIGHGTFRSKVQITPASSRNHSTISDTNIQSELSAQIGAGKLPPPGPNVIYMVNFPKGKRITQGGTSSCVAGGFCAYHGTFKRNGVEVFYGVLPDMSPGSGCDRGCGSSTQFNNQTSVASHELIETVTDCEVGLATVVGPPLAWYDPNNGEIGDICNGIQGTIAGTDGHTYTVQKEWSNQRNACIVHK